MSYLGIFKNTKEPLKVLSRCPAAALSVVSITVKSIARETKMLDVIKGGDRQVLNAKLFGIFRK